MLMSAPDLQKDATRNVCKYISFLEKDLASSCFIKNGKEKTGGWGKESHSNEQPLI